MKDLGAQLSDSAFLASVDPREKSLWRFLATVVLGAVAFFFAALVSVICAMTIFLVASGDPPPSSLANVRALVEHANVLLNKAGGTTESVFFILSVALPSNVAPMFAFIGVACWIGRRRLIDFVTAAPRFRWRLFLSGLVMSTLLVGPLLYLSEQFTTGAPSPPLLTIAPDLPTRAIYGLVCVVAFIPAALGEEIAFRGWFLRLTSVLTRNAPILMLINGIVFAAAHMDFAPDAFVTRAIMGAGFTYSTLRLGGVEFSSGLHASNNIMIVLFFEPLTLKPSPNTPITADSLAPELVLLLIYIGMVEIVARWAPLRRWAGAERPVAVPVAGGTGPWDNF